jgi:hypothetical protein
MRKQIFFVIVLILAFFTPAANAHADLTFAVDIPYHFAGSTIQTGGKVNALFRLENRGLSEQAVDVSVMLPTGLTPLDLPSGWQVAGNRLTGRIDLAGGYDHWFELMSFRSDLPSGSHTLTVALTAGNDAWTETVVFSTQERRAESQAELALTGIRLPLDRYGNADLRVEANTLMLRDKTWDYYKNVLRGKGAVSAAAEYSHPLTFMGLEFKNPKGEAKLLTVAAQLLDKTMRQPVSGLYTPAASVEDAHTAGFNAQTGRTVAFIALNGEDQQRADLPLYADEDRLAGGDYWLQIMVEEDGTPLFIQEIPVRVIAANTRAAWVTAAALLLVTAGLLVCLCRWRQILAGLKTRWLITIALFGSASFAVVNVPTALLNDLLQVVLGPFAFLATGMFSGVIYYMLLASLVLLIPRPGAVLLMVSVRMLLGMLIFGHATPVSFLMQGSQAFILEIALYVTGFTKPLQAAAPDEQTGQETGTGQLLLLALTLGAADSVSTFINLHVLSLLYRLFYADWYIALCIVVNGFCYSAIGAGCGVLLGNKLRKVGCD